MTEHEFCLWVAKWIFEWQNEYNELDGAFCELACRKLNKLGIVAVDDSEWHFEDNNSIPMIDNEMLEKEHKMFDRALEIIDKAYNTSDDVTGYDCGYSKACMDIRNSFLALKGGE